MFSSKAPVWTIVIKTLNTKLKHRAWLTADYFYQLRSASVPCLHLPKKNTEYLKRMFIYVVTLVVAFVYIKKTYGQKATYTVLK